MNRVNPIYKPARRTTARYRLLYGGAGSGKSVFVAQDEMDRAWNDPRHRILVLRKVATTIRNSTFALIKDVLIATGRIGLTKVRESEMSFTFPGGGQIIHAGLDDTEKLKSISGITRIWVEEATELDFSESINHEPDLAQIDLRLRGVDPELIPQITLTFNPTNTARRIFDYVGFNEALLPSRSYVEQNGVYVQHTTYLDNKYVGDDYVQVFRRLGGVMQTVYEHGQLAMIDAPDQLIKYEWVKRAFERQPSDAAHDGRQRLSVDVARFGNDETVIGRFNGLALVEVEAVQGQDTTTTAHRVLSIARQHAIPAELTVVDTVGVGSGVADILRSLYNFDVKEVVGGASPIDHVEAFTDEAPAFNNLRSQMWFYLRLMLERGKVAISPDLPTDVKKKIQEDLLAPRYRYGQDRRIEVEPKDGTSRSWSIRQRLGRSPDYGDMLAMGVFAEHIKSTVFGFISVFGNRQ